MSDEEKEIYEDRYHFAVKEWEGEVPKAPAKRKKISLCMIVKNEEALLAQCLESAKDVVDEMIIVDTGSTDKTVGIAESYGAKVFHFPWNGSFADARNISLEHAAGDWILILDADEILSSDDKDTIPKLIQRDDMVGFLFRIKNVLEETDNAEYHEHFFVRLFPCHPSIRYVGDIHEQVTHLFKGADGKEIRLPIDRIFTLVTIFHSGYNRKMFVDRNKAERNIKILQNLVSQEKKNGFHHLNLAVTYWCAGEFQKAIEEYELARKYVNPKLSFYPMILTGGAGTLISMGKGKQAILWAKEAVKMLPDVADTHFCLGSAYEKAEMYDLAVEEYKVAIECGLTPAAHIVHDPSTSTWKPWNQIGIVSMKAGKPDEAIEAFEKALELKPEAHYLIHNLAFAHLQRGDFEKAENVFRHLLFNTNDTRDFWRLIDLYKMEKKYGEMVDFVEEFVKNHPDQHYVWGGIGFTLFQAEAANFAKIAFKKLVEKEVSSSAFNNLGAVLSQLGEVSEAISCFENALKLEPYHLEAGVNLARCFLQSGKPQEAYAIIENFPEGEYHEQVLQAQAEAAVASFSCEEIMKKKPDNVRFLKCVGSLLLLQKQRGLEAVPLFQRLLELEPDNPQLLYQSGMAFMNAGDPERARGFFSRALERNPNMLHAKAGLLAAQTLVALNSAT